MPRKWIVAASIVVLAAAAGGIVIARSRKPKPAPAATAPAPPAATEAILTGRVLARSVVPVAAPIEGIVDAYYLDAGQPVYQDQLLGRIRSPQLETAAQQAQADLDYAQARVTTLTGEQLVAKLEVSRSAAEQSRAHGDLDRLEKQFQRQKGLWDAGATPRLAFEKSEKDFHDAQATVERLDAAAKDAAGHAVALASDLDAANRAVTESTAALDRAKAALSTGEIHSPADGIVMARHGQPGDPVDPSVKDLFQIATDLTELQVVAPADASTLARLHAGQSAAVRVPELSPDEIPGTVREVRAGEVTIDFTSPSAASTLGLTATVRVKF